MNTEYTNSRTAIDRQLLTGQEVPLRAWLFRKWSKMVLILFFTVSSVWEE